MIDINDYDIQCIEHEILWKYDKSPCDYPDCDCLLSLRKDMINERVLANQEEILPDIIAFNDAMTDALRELYDRAHRIWNSIKDNEDFKGAEIEQNAILVTTIRNFIPSKVMIGKICGMPSVTLVGTNYMTMVFR